MNKAVRELKAFLEEYRAEIRRSAYELLDQEMPAITEDLFSLFEKNGNRLKYEAVYFTRRKFLTVLGMEAVLEETKADEEKRAAGENGRFSEVQEKLCYVLEEICNEECWALPAHVNRKENPNWRITVDLFASETAQTLSELSDRLKERLPDRLRERIAQEVERRVFIPFFSSQIPYGGWEHSDNNWNAVCAGSIGSACIHLLKKEPQRLQACLNRICQALPFYVKGFAEDGACMEGLGYYTYGMTYFADFAQELYVDTNGERDLFCGKWGDFEASGCMEDKRTRMAYFPAKCFFPDGRTVSFSDGNSRDTYRVGILSVLAMHFPDVQFPNIKSAAGLHSDPCYRFAAVKMDMLNTAEYLKQLENAEKDGGKDDRKDVGKDIRKAGDRKQEKEEEKEQENKAFYVLPSAQWCIGHAADKTGFACKGGNNGESHNHNDIGHFLYEAEGVMFLTDLGAGEYTKDYFSGKRYHILCNNSFSHSVPILDGKGQCAGAEYKCGEFSAAEDGSVSMELGGAYEPWDIAASEQKRKKILRRLQFDLDSGRLELTDSFSEAGERVTENLVTQILPRVEGNRVFLEKDGVKAVIEVQDEQIASGQESIVIKEQQHSNHEGIMEQVYQIQWKVNMSNGCGKSKAAFWVIR